MGGLWWFILIVLTTTEILTGTFTICHRPLQHVPRHKVRGHRLGQGREAPEGLVAAHGATQQCRGEVQALRVAHGELEAERSRTA